MSGALTRRDLLGRALLASPGLVLLVRAAAGRAATEADCAALQGLLPDAESAAGLGRAVAAALPEVGPAEACRALVSELPPGDDLADRLRERIRRDFADGRTVRADGWVLSLTEARLAVLARA